MPRSIGRCGVGVVLKWRVLVASPTARDCISYSRINVALSSLALGPSSHTIFSCSFRKRCAFHQLSPTTAIAAGSSTTFTTPFGRPPAGIVKPLGLPPNTGLLATAA
jgi:hypothetical protein